MPRFIIDTRPQLKVVTQQDRPKRAAPAVKPLATSESELVELVTDHSGTITCHVTPQMYASEADTLTEPGLLW